MKQRITYAAFALLGLTLTACHTKDELPQVDTRIERPARISAPFIGQIYYEALGDAATGTNQFSYFIELKDDGTVEYKRYRSSSEAPEVITGKYTYDPETQKITFSDLVSSSTGPQTPQYFYFEDAIYDESGDRIVFRNGADHSDIYFTAGNLSKSVPASFVGLPYAGYITDQAGARTYYRLTFYKDKTIYGTQIKDGVEKILTGKYDFTRSSGAITFSELVLAGQATTSEALGLNANSSYHYTSGLQLGGHRFVYQNGAVLAPFTDTAYAISYKSDDQSIVYRRELTLRTDGTCEGVYLQNGEATGRFSGRYTYSAQTGALTFSSLKRDTVEVTAADLYLDNNPRYDAADNELILSGAYYRPASQVPVEQPAPAAFLDKIYSSSFTAPDGKVYKDSYEFKADGQVHYRTYTDGQLTWGFNGWYTYNASTGVIVFSKLLDLQTLAIIQSVIDRYNNGAIYSRSANQFTIDGATLNVEN